MSSCNGLCLTGYDIGLPSAAIAYAHPDCPEHGYEEPLTPEQEEEALAHYPDEGDRCPCRKFTGDTDECSSCGHLYVSHGAGAIDGPQGECWEYVPAEGPYA